MTYLKDLIDIPDHVGRGDFVLRLSEGVTDPEGTVKHYQVTPQLTGCFDQALGLIKGALVSGNGKPSSKAAYLHGSFGSGKSHFMAILYLLLHGDAHARSIPELAEVVTKHNEWTGGKKFLMVPFHLLNARNLESAILGGYASFIERTHPDAPVPAIFRAEGLLQNAEQLRATMGDAVFFAKLNEGKSGGAAAGGWGNISSTWDAVRYTKALQASPTSEECRKLVRDLVETHLPAMKNTEDFVDLDDGLAIISAHAKEIGYDALVLFLDELILWLASYAGDPAFVSREGNKLVKLVESSRADRPVPIISFIARQRDLRDMIGQHIAGAERLAFAHVLDHHEGRFGVINLEDRNLPAIAEKRILLPKSPAAKQQMDAEFARTSALREEVMKTLLTRNSNRDDFRKLYPFSPALVDTLVAVSSLLQRERTALKVMALLLSSQKETLRLGQIVPVGDLFDQVSQGDEAFSSDMKIHFENAHRLYRQHLKPLLEKEHNLSFEEAAELPWDDQKRSALRNDDRLMKTLLLAALVPEVEALKDMTPARLAALNHGTIQSPIPGQEATTVINKFKKWAAAAGQIKVREGAGSTGLAIQLSSVDTEQILAKAEAVDNYGNRIRKLKELIFNELGHDSEERLQYSHEFRWRGTSRQADIIFANIRELPAESLVSKGGNWKVVIDYPFDQNGHSVRDDIAKLEAFRNDEEDTRTICWVPSFFNEATMTALGTFIRLEQILKDSQFPNYVQHLNETDRETARNQLDSQRSQLRSQLLVRIEMAYGIRGDGEDYLDTSNLLEPAEQFISLDGGVSLQAPAAANIGQGLTSLLDQALRQQFPKHPLFEDKLSLTKGAIGKVLEVVRAAAQSSEASVLVDGAVRNAVRLLAEPLKLGAMGETRFQIGQHWKTHFNKQAAQNTGALTVGKLRTWIDLPDPMGLPEVLQDLLILAYAEQTNRIFKYHAGPAQADLGTLTDEMTLEEVALPAESQWTVAIERAKAIFGLPASPLLNAANVTSLGDALHARVKELAPRMVELIARLEPIRAGYFPAGNCARLQTAQEGLALLRTMEGSSGNTLIAALAGFDLSAHPAAMASSLASSGRLAQTLEDAEWQIFEGARNLSDERKAAAQEIWRELETAFQSDEHAVALAPKLASLKNAAVALLTRPVTSATPAPSAPTPPPEQVEPVVALPPGKNLNDLKRLYEGSQIAGETLPAWVKGEDRLEMLKTCQVGANGEGWASVIVVGPLYHSLIRLDPAAKLDLAGGKLSLPRFGQVLDLTVKPEHLES
jgi:hypothetical protein